MIPANPDILRIVTSDQCAFLRKEQIFSGGLQEVVLNQGWAEPFAYKDGLCVVARREEIRNVGILDCDISSSSQNPATSAQHRIAMNVGSLNRDVIRKLARRRGPSQVSDKHHVDRVSARGSRDLHPDDRPVAGALSEEQGRLFIGRLDARHLWSVERGHAHAGGTPRQIRRPDSHQRRLAGKPEVASVGDSSGKVDLIATPRAVDGRLKEGGIRWPVNRTPYFGGGKAC